MLRRLLPLLITCLMLMSQQVALSHGYTHWAPVQKVAAGGTHSASSSASASVSVSVSNGASSLSLTDHLCLQCLAATELAFAISGPPLRFAVPDSEAVLGVLQAAAVRERITTVAFQSRAPPVL